MRRLSLFILVFVTLISCQDIEKPEKPEAFIPEDQMIDILYDISIIRSLKTYNVNEMRMLDIKPESYIYDKYNIDSIQLADNISYYAIDFNKYAALWEKVRVRLAAEHADVEERISKSDSIKINQIKNNRDSIMKANRLTPESARGLEINDSLVEPVSG